MASTTDSRGRIALRPRVTVNELAVALRCNPETVRRYWREGRIPGARVGNAVTFAAEDVEKFLNDNGIDNVVMLEAV